MKVTLYLPYYDYNDNAFNVDESYYGNGEYANAMYDEFMKSKNVVESHMNDIKNGTHGGFIGVDGKTYKFGQKTSENEDKVAYSSCEAVLYDDSGSDETVDGLIEKFAHQTDFVEMVELDLDTSEEEFETEYSIWEKEHNNINAYRNKAGDAWVSSNEPKRNIKVHFKNNADEDIYALLEECKIMDSSESSAPIIYVKKITLIDNI